MLVGHYRPSVVRTAFGLVGSLERAEDVAQDVFMRVWRKLPSYVETGAFRSWLQRITVNVAIDALRRQPELVELDPEVADHDPRPEQLALRAEGQARLRQAVMALPPKARAALVLREFEELSYQEIAEALQVPMGTVMSRLNYARRALRQALELDNL